jgi:hypothetical protein
MEAAAPFARLDPDQTRDALPGPGAAGRPERSSERRAVAGKSKLGQALAFAADTAGTI